jgi:hypothetical protein
MNYIDFLGDHRMVNKAGKAVHRRYRVCAKENKQRDYDRLCPSCPSEPPLCLGDCFEIYHTQDIGGVPPRVVLSGTPFANLYDSAKSPTEHFPE